MSNQANNAPSELEALDGERGMPSVNQDGPSTKKRALALLAILAVLAVAGGVGYWKWTHRADASAAAEAEKS